MDERQKVKDKVWNLLSKSGFEGRVPEANVQVIIDYVCRDVMPSTDLITTLLMHGQATDMAGTSPTVSLEANTSTTNIASSPNLQTSPRETQRDINHLSGLQGTSQCKNSGGTYCGDCVHSCAKRISEAVQHLGCCNATCGCLGLNVKQEMSTAFKSENTRCDSNVTDGSPGLNVKQELSTAFKSENTGCDSNVTDGSHDLNVKQELSTSFKLENIECDSMFGSDTRQDSSNSLCCIMEVKNETDAKIWWNQLPDAESDSHCVGTEDNHQPEGAAALHPTRKSKKTHEMQYKCLNDDTEPTRIQKEKESHNDSVHGKPGGKRDKSLEIGDKPNFVCPTCGKTFVVKAVFDSHMSSHSIKETYNLRSEDYGEISECQNLDSNDVLHSEEAVYKCSFCEETFSVLISLQTHETKHTDENLYKCSKCAKTFSALKNLRRHERFHGVPKYKCSICDMAFFETYYLQRHEKTHVKKIKKHKGTHIVNCTVCDKKFPTSEMRKHTTKTLKCSTCNKEFHNLPCLRRHEETHTDETPCSICNKAFSQPFCLRRRERTDTGEKFIQMFHW